MSGGDDRCGIPIPYALGVLRLSTEGLQVIEIDGVKYSAEIFRTFAAPDPQKYYRFVRDGETVTVTEFRIEEPRT